jgi:phosphoribosylaminoimidazole (AIR) synthetase
VTTISGVKSLTGMISWRNVNRLLEQIEYSMNETQLVLLGLMILGASVIFFYLTDIIPAKVENTEMTIIISLGIGLLISVIDKRQNRYLDEIIETQHKMTNEIHKMIKEQLTIIKEMHKDDLNE